MGQFNIIPWTTSGQSAYYPDINLITDPYNVSVPAIPSNWLSSTPYDTSVVLPGPGSYGNMSVIPGIAGDQLFTIKMPSIGNFPLAGNQTNMLSLWQ
jgi:hypothetical protein